MSIFQPWRWRRPPQSDSDPLRRSKLTVLLLTFIAYASYHASRKPPSIVKPVLGPQPLSSPSSSGWAPFSGPDGPHRLGELDLFFLSSYALSMFLSGHLADRTPIGVLLPLSMLLSALSTAAFALAYFLDLHSFAFFAGVQILGGVFQSAGWPCVVAVVGNWFGKERRGLVMGMWSANASVGNVVGSVVAASVLKYGWGWAFVVPAGVLVVVAGLVWRFLVVRPEEVVEEEVEMVGSGEAEVDSLLGSGGDGGDGGAIGFMEAWRLPGVAAFAGCLFFSKLVAYTFLYWLPFYIRHTAVAGHHLSHRTAGILSIVFDIGGVFGGTSAGYISDKLEARAFTSLLFLVISIPALILYRVYGSVSNSLNILLMFFSGFFVNGPYALITTAVAADLGTQDQIKDNERCLATVTAIIDGTGSVGAALGPLLTGYVSTTSWNGVFVMLILAISLACMFLVHLAKAEISKMMTERK